MKTTLLISSLLLAGGLAHGQTCSGNQDFQGAYMLVASRLAPIKAPPPPTVPGPGPSLRFSNTAVGRVLDRATGIRPLAVTGRITSDGLGNLLAAAPDATYVTTRVGIYRVNEDCTMTLTLADGFSANLNFFGDIVPGAFATFQGVLHDRGNEASLTQTGQGSETVLRLDRPISGQNCVTASLSGVYGIVASGVDTGDPAAPETLPVSLLGRFVAENGVFKLDTPGIESPQPKRQITGTYRVEPDCTGAARMVQDGKTFNADFVLVRGGVTFGAFQRAELRFAIQDARVTMTGVGR